MKTKIRSSSIGGVFGRILPWNARQCLRLVFTFIALGLVLGTSGMVRAMVGGATIPAAQLAPGGTFEWLVRLEGPGGRCTGSLIASDWVLTAAHCGSPTTAFVGNDTVGVAVVEVVVHPSYIAGQPEFDAALLRIATPSAIRPVNRSVASLTLTAGQTPITLAGWGVTSPGGAAVVEPSSGVTTVTTVNIQLLAAGTPTIGCGGDSGGPMLFSGTLVGVISSTVGSCNTTTIGARFSSIATWVRSIAGRSSFNIPPVVLSGELSVDYASTIAIPFEFSDPDGPTLTFENIVGFIFGRLELIECDSSVPPTVCHFTAHAGFAGDTVMTYTVDDGNATATASWTVHIGPNPVPIAPVASNVRDFAWPGLPANLELSAFDSNLDTLTYAIASPPANGSVACVGKACVYTSPPDFLGRDTFTFTANDGTFTSNVASVEIRVFPGPVNGSGLAVGQSPLEFELYAGVSGTFEGIVTPPLHGTLNCVLPPPPEPPPYATGFCTYQANANFIGVDTFTWRAVSEQMGANLVLTFTINVVPPPVVFTVTTTAETGPGSWLAAVLAIRDNHCAGPNKRIEFNIPAATDPGCNPVTGVCVVQLEFFNGRNISCPNVVVDGYTQPGAVANTATDRTNNAQLKIEFAGTNPLTLNHDNITMRGIAFAAVQVNIGIRSVFGAGLVSTGGQVLAGNYFGWHADGLTPAGFNGEHRVSVGSSPLVFSARIGGPIPADRNLITHTLHGNGLRLSGASNALVEGNVVNLDRNGNPAAGANSSQGILLDVGGNNVNTIRRNVITQTKVSGVQCTGGSSTTLSENEIFDVGSSGAANARGIELQPGCNRNQTAPVITGVTEGASVTVLGTLNSVANETYKIEFFHNSVADTQNLGRAEKFVDVVQITTNAAGFATFSATLPAFVRNVSATATRLSTGDTSQISRFYTGPLPTLTVSKSGSGGGIVTSAPAGIDCGASCSGSFVQGSAVTLTAVATAGSTFGGWAGACTNATGTCSVTMDAVKAVTANFIMLDTIAPTPGFSLQPAAPAVGTLQRISFAPSTDAGGSGIDTYAISLLSCGGGCQPYELGGGNGQYSILSAQDIGFTFTPLAGGAFRFAVIVTDKAGNVGTAEFTFNISATPTATVPSAPVITSASPGERSATLAFSTPADGGSAITGYTATCGTRSATGLFSPLTVTGLANAVAASCTVRADNVIGNGPVSAAVSVTPQSTLVLQSAHSRKTHGAAGEFAVPINLNATIDGNVSVEPRISSGSQKVTFDFNQPIVSVGSVSIFDQNGNEIGQTFVSRANSRITVILAGVPDRTRVEIRLADVNQSRDVKVAMGFLVGDVQESRRVNSIDILTTKRRLMSPTNSVNFRADVTTAGFISPVALSMVKSRSGTSLP